MAEKMTTKNFITKSVNTHGHRFDYSIVDYVNSHTKVQIICLEHGVFEQRPYAHTQGAGCPGCAGTKKLDATLFKKKAFELHGNRYDYSKIAFINTKTKVEIVCAEHGVFWQEAGSHIYLGRGCPHCSGNLPIKPDLTNMDVPKGSKAVPLTQDKYALVDEEDYARVMAENWSYDAKTGYAGKGGTRLHRFVLKAPAGFEVDHINRIKLDCRKRNLRLCTRKENARNLPVRKISTSKFKGVSWSKHTDKWVACITYDRKSIRLCSFDNEMAAAMVYDSAAIKYHGDFAALNRDIYPELFEAHKAILAAIKGQAS